jgi:phosphopantetheine adenylyltransferase
VVLVCGRFDSHELAEIAMSVKEQVVVHLLRKQPKPCLVGSRQRSTLSLSRSNHSVNQSRSYPLRSLLSHVSDPGDRALLVRFLRSFSGRESKFVFRAGFVTVTSTIDTHSTICDMALQAIYYQI